MGPCQRLCMDSFELLLANPSLLAKGMCSISSCHLKLCRPVRQSCMAAQCVLGGPMQAACIHMTVYEMGPFQHLCMDYFELLLANSSSLARECTAFHPSISNYVGPRDSPVWQPSVCLVGQCKLLVCISRFMEWAHVGAYVWILLSCRWPTQAHWKRKCAAFRPPISNYVGPCDSPVWRPSVCLVGQCELLVYT